MDERKRLLGLERYDFSDLNSIMEVLMGEGGCPWDRAQTHHSIKTNLIEEAYEVIDAIEKNDVENLKEELGDLLLQSVFHAKIAEREGEFLLGDVLDRLGRKLVTRHTHIFGAGHADDSDSALKSWEQAKAVEKNTRSVSEDIAALPDSFPQLLRAVKAQKKAAKSGFDFPNERTAADKLYSEVAELKEALAKNDEANIEEELGDIIFAAVNIIRLRKLDAELTLKKSTDKFAARFAAVESDVVRQGRKMSDCTAEELDEICNRVKKAYADR